MKIRYVTRSAVALACSTVLALSACNGKLTVVDDVERQSSNLLLDDASPSDPSALPDETPPPFDPACTCSSSPSLMPLSCGVGAVPLLDNDIVQITPDGSIAAFNIESGFEQQIFYWDGGPSARRIWRGMLIGLSAAGDRVLGTSDLGLTLIDMNSGVSSFPLQMIVGRGSLSADGALVVGALLSNDRFQLARVKADTLELDLLGEVGDYIDRAFVTPDASTIVGTGSIYPGALEDPNAELSPQLAYRANAQGLKLGLPGVPESIEVWPESVSDDGTVIAGRSPTGQTNFRWTEAGGYVELGTASWRSETLLNADGSVVLGSLDPEGDNDSAAFRWTEATGAVDLTPGRASLATDLSDDGNVIVATSWEEAQLDGTYPEDTFIWDVEHGTRTLDQVLADRGVDVSGWEFGHARALSDNGKVLLGRARCGGVDALYRIVLSD